MSRLFAVVHEAEADFTTATDLADRVLMESIDWLDEDHLANQRVWLSKLAEGRRLTWKGIKQLARGTGLRIHGHFEGEPGLPDAAAARRAIRFLLGEIAHLAAVILIRDQDDEPDRRRGLEQARNQEHGKIAVVVGLAIVERECWLISGFDPLDLKEVSRLEAERQRLGFDPRLRSHELTACKDDSAKRSPKRVLRELSGNNPDREQRCWQETSLQALRERGTDNGLADFLQEIRDRLAPLIGHVTKG